MNIHTRIDILIFYRLTQLKTVRTRMNLHPYYFVIDSCGITIILLPGNRVAMKFCSCPLIMRRQSPRFISSVNRISNNFTDFLYLPRCIR